ncbi:PLC-like phosphodiesterase, partial [Kalaharituber pfeilii]
RYSEQLWIGTHHSAMLRTSENGFSLNGNQFHNVTVQLNAGVRLLHGQLHLVGSEVHICHSSCALLDAGTVESFLAEVGSWLDKNEGEVVTILWQNPNDVTPLSYLRRVYMGANLDSISYIPPHREMRTKDWPTIEEMVLAQRRLVTLVDLGANQDQVPYILSLWNYVAETKSEVMFAEGFTCEIAQDRSGSGSAGSDTNGNTDQPGDRRLGMVNHFLYEQKLRNGGRYPDVQRVDKTNAAERGVAGVGGLLGHVDKCVEQWGRVPNFAMVDFFDRGDVFTVQ